MPRFYIRSEKFFPKEDPKPLTAVDLRAVEELVNARIRANARTTTRYMTPDEAVTAGALALFGEKYGEEVRVVSMGGVMGGAVGGAGEDQAQHYSTELCGGTHVRRAGDIGFFKIVGESALAAGVRRIEAVAGQAAFDHVVRQQELLDRAAAALKSPPAQLADRVAALLDERKRLERDLTETRRKLATGTVDGAAAGPAARRVGDVSFARRVLADVPPRDLKPMADDLKASIGSGVVALVAVNEGKASLVVGVTDDLTGRVSAVDLVRVGATALGGKGGGGRPDMAQAGGPDGAAAEQSLSAIESALTALAPV